MIRQRDMFVFFLFALLVCVSVAHSSAGGARHSARQKGASDRGDGVPEIILFGRFTEDEEDKKGTMKTAKIARQKRASDRRDVPDIIIYGKFREDKKGTMATANIEDEGSIARVALRRRTQTSSKTQFI